MKKKYSIIAFIAAALLQLSVPVKMIIDSETTARDGTEFRFRTIPVDPTDYLRGKYIILNYELDEYKVTDTTFATNDPVYIVLKKDKDGFANIKALLHEEPANESDYVQATVNHNYDGTMYIDFAFNRFYMDENKAAEAETAYNDYSSEGSNKVAAYALVAVKNGNAVVTNVIVDGLPIKEFVKKQRGRK